MGSAASICSSAESYTCCSLHVSSRCIRKKSPKSMRPPLLLLLLLLLLVLDGQRRAIGPPGRRLAERLQRDRARLARELRKRPRGGLLRVDLGLEGLPGGAPEDALVGRH